MCNTLSVLGLSKIISNWQRFSLEVSVDLHGSRLNGKKIISWNRVFSIRHGLRLEVTVLSI